MKLKSLLPWLCVLGLLIGLAWAYAASQKKDAELAALREDSQRLQQLQAELEEAKTNSVHAESDELNICARTTRNYCACATRCASCAGQAAARHPTPDGPVASPGRGSSGPGTAREPAQQASPGN